MSEAPICLSGGAEGADLQWGMCAGMAGHMVVHFNFRGHRCKAPKQEQVCLTPEQLKEADDSLVLANERLQRSFPTASEFVNNLLRRNFYQIKDTQSVYAIVSIDPKGKPYGGTAWAIQMFIDRHYGRACPVYAFDQEQDCWFTWEGEDLGWVRLSEDPPAPTGVWTGIGTRNLQQNGKDAIRRLLGYTPAPPETLAA
jgi:hypothetical protein